MPPQVDCGASLVAFFPPEIYNFVGSSAVLPELLQSLDQSALSTVQFLQNGAVRVTFKTRLECERVVSAGIRFRGNPPSPPGRRRNPPFRWWPALALVLSRTLSLCFVSSSFLGNLVGVLASPGCYSLLHSSV